MVEASANAIIQRDAKAAGELEVLIAFVFPPRTTHIFQPLDGSPTRALKERFLREKTL